MTKTSHGQCEVKITYTASKTRMQHWHHTFSIDHKRINYLRQKLNSLATRSRPFGQRCQESCAIHFVVDLNSDNLGVKIRINFMDTYSMIQSVQVTNWQTKPYFKQHTQNLIKNQNISKSCFTSDFCQHFSNSPFATTASHPHFEIDSLYHCTWLEIL